MKNKLFLFLSLTVLVSVLVGLTIEDPWGSKTQTKDNQINVITPVHVSYGTPIFTDNFNTGNDTTSLKARGYKPYYRGTGAQGTIATWYQGQIAVFNAFNGPDTGYVAANYSVVTGANNIDSWLVLPRVAGGLLATDSLFFYERSATGSTYPDSVRVMYSANDSIPEGSWTELGRFKTNTTTGWQRHGFKAAAASVNGRFAIRYCVVNGGPSGANSDYMGIDALTIERSGSGPTATFYSSQWCAAATFPPVPSATYFQASAWLGDTLYVATPTTAGAGANTVIRYTLGGSWTTGVPMPGTKVGGTLTACNGKLYYIGGGTASILTPDAAVYEYTPSTGIWATKAPLPVALAGHGAGNWGDSVIFVVGGPYTGPTGNVYV
ncbi:MAG: choice-of-anchor J domain-containing protein, partial [Ignavibacteriae bacterium]|nr:choice-of-anchor J domain-containing protein [Ignavibacteriota bacterium]